MLIILFGIILSIILRRQKNITFDIMQLDKSCCQDISLMIDENNYNINDSESEI